MLFYWRYVYSENEGVGALENLHYYTFKKKISSRQPTMLMSSATAKPTILCTQMVIIYRHLLVLPLDARTPRTNPRMK